jgi:preprotein translocase subunit YajC
VQGSPLASLIFLGLLIGVFYFMLIRPQKRRVDQHRKLIQSIETGDDVVTIGGLYGSVVSVDDEDVELDVGSGTVLRFTKSAIARIVEDEEEEDEEDEGEEPAAEEEEEEA